MSTGQLTIRGIIAWTLIIVLTGAAILGGCLWSLSRQLASQKEERREKPPGDPTRELTAMGFPASLEAVEAWYMDGAPADGDNAAPVYQAAFDAYRNPEPATVPDLPFVSPSAVLESGESMDAAMRSAIEAYTERNAESIALLHEAADKPACHWPFSPPNENGSEHTWRTEGAVRLLGMNALLLAERGEFDEAWTCLHSALMALRVVEGHPFAQDVASYAEALETVAIAFGHVVNRAPATDEVVEALRLGSRHHETWARRVLWAEYALDVELGRALESGPPRHEATDVWAAWGLSEGLEALERETIPRVLHMRALRQYLYRLGQGTIYRRTEWFNDSYLDAFKAAENALRAELALKGMQCAAAIAAYHAGHAEWPARLEDLVPEYVEALPEDPFSGEPFAYTVEDRGFSLSTAGISTERAEAVIAKLEDAGIQYLPEEVPPCCRRPWIRPWYARLPRQFDAESRVLNVCRAPQRGEEGLGQDEQD